MNQKIEHDNNFSSPKRKLIPENGGKKERNQKKICFWSSDVLLSLIISVFAKMRFSKNEKKFFWFICSIKSILMFNKIHKIMFYEIHLLVSLCLSKQKFLKFLVFKKCYKNYFGEQNGKKVFQYQLQKFFWDCNNSPRSLPLLRNF